jgi:hypothetical protein
LYAKIDVLVTYILESKQSNLKGEFFMQLLSLILFDPGEQPPVQLILAVGVPGL